MPRLTVITDSNDPEAAYARTILQQIRQADPLALPSWGVRDIYAREHDRSLKFNVNGLRHRGWVLISLRGDLYNIEAATDRGGEWKVKETAEGVYAEDLVKFLDGIIDGRGN